MTPCVRGLVASGAGITLTPALLVAWLHQPALLECEGCGPVYAVLTDRLVDVPFYSTS